MSIPARSVPNQNIFSISDSIPACTQNSFELNLPGRVALASLASTCGSYCHLYTYLHRTHVSQSSTQKRSKKKEKKYTAESRNNNNFPLKLRLELLQTNPSTCLKETHIFKKQCPQRNKPLSYVRS